MLVAGPVPAGADTPSSQDDHAAEQAVHRVDGPGASQFAAQANQGGYVRNHCVGTKIDGADLTSGTGQLVGRVELWYSPSGPPAGRTV
ncbi:hypothetical protein [Ornithinicoccus hortensis]|uniref:Uncharacterized protein n=1 Tax=Ornithinicoccus hortensis TaxID=82346 RepID=A0A542YSR7_9MICO|nr:hypothetical protein [Ornithinicoccus hortensis]TQL51145.1 hypothetical protein FB467_2281 [Ornithinicoccus hortensis]